MVSECSNYIINTTLHISLMTSTFAASLLARQWRKPDEPGQELSPRVFRISSTSTTFSQYYDEIQEQLKSIAGMDQLLPGTHEHCDHAYAECILALVKHSNLL